MNVGDIVRSRKSGKHYYITNGMRDGVNVMAFGCVGDAKVLSVSEVEVIDVNSSEWLANEVFKNLKELNEKQDNRYLTEGEKKFLTFIDPDCYLVRNEGGLLLICEDRPGKGEHSWYAPSRYCQIRDQIFMPMKFEAVRWTDNEPMKVMDLLKLEVR